MEMNEELNTIEEKDEAVFEEDAELTAEELSQVTGGKKHTHHKEIP